MTNIYILDLYIQFHGIDTNPQNDLVTTNTVNIYIYIYIYSQRPKTVGVDYSRIVFELITFNSVVDIIMTWGIYVEEVILGNLDINSKLGFLISGVVNSP